MLRQLMESFKNDLRNNPKFVWIFSGVMGFVLICSVAGIVISCLPTAAPDPNTASFDKIEEYLGSKDYMEKSLAERKKYVAVLVDRMDKKKNPDFDGNPGEIMRRLWKRNRKAATSIEVSALSHRMSPISSLPDKEKAQRINMFLSMAEMRYGRRKMQENYENMFGSTGKGAKNQENMIKKAVQTMPMAMNSTTPAERRRMMRTVVVAKRQMDRRYGSSSSKDNQQSNK